MFDYHHFDFNLAIVENLFTYQHHFKTCIFSCVFFCVCVFCVVFFRHYNWLLIHNASIIKVDFSSVHLFYRLSVLPIFWQMSLYRLFTYTCFLHNWYNVRYDRSSIITIIWLLIYLFSALFLLSLSFSVSGVVVVWSWLIHFLV